MIDVVKSSFARIDLALAFDVGPLPARLALRSEAGAIAITGPSGIGKTTLLRAIAGWVRGATGRVAIGGHVLEDRARGLSLLPEARRIGWVSQDASLFPHLTARENVAFSPACTRDAIDEAIACTEIAPLLSRAPSTLSGGERQRVAIARALARSPSTLLFDEGLPALDRSSRDTLAEALRAYAPRHDVTLIAVSHDESDLHRLSDERWAMRVRDQAIETESAGVESTSARDPGLRV